MRAHRRYRSAAWSGAGRVYRQRLGDPRLGCRCRPACRLPPKGPVTMIASPALPRSCTPLRGRLTRRSRVTQITSGPSQALVSPPTRSTLNRSASGAHSGVDSRCQIYCAGVRNRDRRPARCGGTPAMAAISDRFAPQGPCSQRARSVPCEAEVATIHQHVGGDQQISVGATSKMAQSSPMPSLVHGLRTAALALARESNRSSRIRPGSQTQALAAIHLRQRPFTIYRPARNPRMACSVARSSSLAAWPWLVQARSGRGRSRNRRRFPGRKRLEAPGPIAPARASTGQPAVSQPGDADGRLAEALWPSIAPSPVRQRSAFSRRDSRSTASMTRSIPGDSLPLAKATRPPPSPPAVPSRAGP